MLSSLTDTVGVYNNEIDVVQDWHW